MRVWIDATEADDRIRIFGMTRVERLLRAIGDAGLEPTHVDVVTREASPSPSIPRALQGAFSIRHVQVGDDSLRALEASLVAEPGPLLALRGDAVVDTRLLAHLAERSGAWVFSGSEGGERSSVMRLDRPVAMLGASWNDVADALVARRDAVRLEAEDVPGYITMLRRELPPYVFAVPDDAARRRGERFLFWSNYKGSTDFMTRYVYPPFVWLLVHPLARLRVHPHWVTGVDILATFAAIPFFMEGRWVIGLLLAFLMSVLDSVDGKLARLTFTSSKLGEILDHGLDIVHPPLWYLAWGWALGAYDAASMPFQASLWMFGFYVADRVVTGIFKARHGKSIHGFTPFDERMRTFISRRNVNLPFFTLALVLDAVLDTTGWPIATACFYAIVAWQVFCTCFHAQRLLKFWSEGERPSAA